ncbi:PREDICTED: uromodulin-like [Nanorana parkeri]|uniref:uromodulin-like n=1 Tax=Nanorana parkeri TaxID=125878 RepID=UPI000854D5E1|nr:PREDICTED: uromodulin-like [Nanorana parkeri]
MVVFDEVHRSHWSLSPPPEASGHEVQGKPLHVVSLPISILEPQSVHTGCYRKEKAEESFGMMVTMNLLFLVFISCSVVAATSNCSKCHPEATCADYFGYLQCSCKDGFIGDGFNCSDVDECAYYWSNNCGYYTCVNTYGSYYCMCPSGYRNDSGAGCVDVDECSNPGLNTCTVNATCTNTIGSYTCVCAPGYFGDGFSCEVDECALGVCGSGMECSKYYGSYSCYDPCLTYTTLNDPWRSTSYVYYSYYFSYYWNCDSDKFGWYRFVGSGGVKMPESCVFYYSCGTAAPMWLQGSHPLISDGIVNRTACAYLRGDCCSWSTTVQIKSCPDNYYVYKLSGTPACSLAYCTDPSSVTDVCACAETEQCSLVDGKYGCYCKDEYNISDISEIRPILTCGAHEMRVSFLKCQLKSQDIDASKLTTANIGCYTLQDDIVNGTYSKSTTHATYISTIDILLGSSNDLFIPQEVTVQMKCSYPLNIQVSLNTAMNPMVSFQDASYTLPYEAPVVEMSSKSFLYVGVTLDGPGNSPYIVLMKNCFGTPTNNINDTIKYHIIKDSCPIKQDSTISVPINGVSNEGRFSLQLFRFITRYSQIYLHCEINLCDPTTNICTPE